MDKKTRYELIREVMDFLDGSSPIPPITKHFRALLADAVDSFYRLHELQEPNYGCTSCNYRFRLISKCVPASTIKCPSCTASTVYFFGEKYREAISTVHSQHQLPDGPPAEGLPTEEAAEQIASGTEETMNQESSDTQTDESTEALREGKRRLDAATDCQEVEVKLERVKERPTNYGTSYSVETTLGWMSTLDAKVGEMAKKLAGSMAIIVWRPSPRNASYKDLLRVRPV